MCRFSQLYQLLILAVTASAFPQTTPTIVSAEINQIEHLIPEIANAHFSSCNIVIAHDVQDINPGSSPQIPTSNTNFRKSIHSIVSTLFRTYSRDLYFVNYMNFNITKNSPYPSALGGSNRLRPNCYLSIIFIESIRETTFHQLFHLLTPPTFELTKKDEDHYIIVSANEALASPILLSRVFTMRIQYKLLMYQDESNNQLIQFRTMCFYCNSGPSGKEKVIEIVIDGLDNKILPTKSQLFPEMVRNFNGYQMRVVCPTGTHQQARMKQVDGEYMPMSGSYFITMDHLVQVFNFTYKVGPSTLGGTGLQQPNGTWTGTVGDILYERADIGLVTAITYQRYKIVGYNYPVTWEWLTFGTAIPVPKFTWEALFWPFSKEVWMAVLTCLIGVIIIFTCLRRFSKSSNTEEKSEFKIADTSTYVWGTILEQSLSFPTQPPLKILIIVWVFTVVILGTGYRSKLVTCLAFPVVEKPPSNFDELAVSGYKVGLCYVGGAAYNVFKSSNNPTYVKLYKVMELFKDMTDCFVRTLQHKVSCIGYESMASYVLNKNLTDRFGRAQIQVTTASTFFVGCGYVITKRAIFRPNFDRYIMTWMDFGLLGEWRKRDHESVRRLRTKWVIETGQKRDSGHEEDGPSKLSIESLKVVFVMLVLGVAAGGVAFLVEQIHGYGLKNVGEVCKKKLHEIDTKLNYIR